MAAKGKDTYLGLGYLRQVDLVGQMSVAHTVLVAFAPTASGCVCNRQAPIVAFVLHFQVHAYSPVNSRARAVHINVCDTAFDDLCEDFACFLIGRDSNFGFMARVQILANDGRKLGRIDFIEGIALLLMCVGERYPF